MRLIITAAADNVDVHKNIYAMMAREIYQYELFFGDRPATARVAAILLNFALRSGDHGQPENCFELAMTRSDLASYLRLATETVSQVLHQFNRDKLIQLNNRKIQILDSSGLDEIANQRGKSEDKR